MSSTPTSSSLSIRNWKRSLSSIWHLGTLLLLAAFALTLTARAQVNVYTRSNDNGRTGQNLQETILTPANVTAANFGKLYTVHTDGQIYAQPLYVSNLTVGGAAHNVLLVASMLNTVYAIDADTGTTLWSQNFGSPINPKDVETDGNIVWETKLGILGTPVIDPATNYMYFVSGSQPADGSAVYNFNLNAIDITTGLPITGSPVQIQGSYSTADLTAPLIFNAKIHNPRPGLALANGNVYIAFASHEDQNAYHGFVMAYSTSTLQQTAIYSDTTVGYQGGIWSAGQAPSVDGAGNLYISTGNGSFGKTANNLVQTGNSFIKLSPTLTLLDYFTPYNSGTLNSGDQDLGSSGLMLIPNTTLAIGGGKQGVLYLVDTTGMGGFNTSADQIKQEFQAVYGKGTSHIHGGPAYFNSDKNGPTIFNWGENDVLRGFTFNGATLNTTPFAMGKLTAPVTNNDGAMPGGFLSISANGNTNGILWASTPYNGDAVHHSVQGVVYAYDADTLNLLWSDKDNDARDEIGTFAKYVPPVIANGKVFMATFGAVGTNDGSGALVAYGLLKPQVPVLTITAANATRAFGAANPTFTGTVTGAANGDTFTETFTTTATATSDVGAYPIVPAATGTNIADYTVTPVNGSLTVTAATTTTTLVAPASALPATATTLTATVASTAGTPAGTVTFASGATALGTAPLNASGVATLSTTALPAGTDAVVASYTAAGNYAASTSAASSIVVSQTAQTITFAAIAAHVYGSAPFAVTATSSLGAAYPVTIAVKSGPATISGGVVTLTGVGTVVLIASQAGDAGHDAATATQMFQVTPAPTTTTLTAPASAAAGAAVALSASVASTAGVVPGTVTFNYGSMVLGTGTLAAGVATLSTTALPAGTDVVTATFAASGNFDTSTSAGVTVAIAAPAAASYGVVASPAALTIAAGSTGKTTLTFTGSGGYIGSVALTCTGLPANATCAFDQSQVSLTADAQTTATGLTINTTAASARGPLPSNNSSPSAFLALAFWCPGGLTGLAIFIRRRKATGAGRVALLGLLVLGTCAFAIGLSGCGGGSMNGSSTTAQPTTSQVSIVATGNDGGTVTTKTVSLSLTMTQ